MMSNTTTTTAVPTPSPLTSPLKEPAVVAELRQLLQDQQKQASSLTSSSSSSSSSAVPLTAEEKKARKTPHPLVQQTGLILSTAVKDMDGLQLRSHVLTGLQRVHTRTGKLMDVKKTQNEMWMLAKAVRGAITLWLQRGHELTKSTVSKTTLKPPKSTINSSKKDAAAGKSSKQKSSVPPAPPAPSSITPNIAQLVLAEHFQEHPMINSGGTSNLAHHDYHLRSSIPISSES